MSGPMDISEISAMLAGRIETLAAELLPAGRRHGPEWVEARKAAGGLGDSLRVHLTGGKAGVWSHFGAGEGGDALDLVAYLRTGGDKGRAVAWSRAWLGLDDADPAALEARRRRARAEAETRERRSRADAERAAKRAFALWLSGVPIPGTPAEAYLKGRGIDLASLGRAPGALRFHPRIRCVEADADLPCLLAAVNGPAVCPAPGAAQGYRMLTVHRTWLETRPDGVVTKARLAEPKKTYSGYRGGWIPLWRGETVDPKTGEVRPAPRLSQAPAGSGVTIAEGIEDGLTVTVSCPERRILSAVSLGNLAALAETLPPAIATVTIVADNDTDPAAIAALDRAIAAFKRSGRRVFLTRPPRGVKDVNILLQGAGATAERRDGPGSEAADGSAADGGAR